MSAHKPQKTTKKVVVLGGGTGSYVLLSGLKRRVGNLTALVNMVDNGGSTGRLRDELGVLPPGDVRQCLVALATNERLRELCGFRFDEGPLRGHSFGNLMLAALEKQTGNFGAAVKAAEGLLATSGTVLPVTLDDVHLVLQQGDGTVVYGQRDAEDVTLVGRPRLSLEPCAVINPTAQQAIADADLIVLAPGDLYTSLAPLLLVQGTAEALAVAPAPVVYVANLMTRAGQTDGFAAHDLVHELERIAGVRFADQVICNTGVPTDEQLRHYAQAGEQVVCVDEAVFAAEGRRTWCRDVIARDAHIVQPDCDELAHIRSYVRHDPDALANVIIEILENQQAWTNQPKQSSL